MCGIAGLVDPDAARLARLMGGHLAHRGPDDEGDYADAANGFAMTARRLSIIDVPGGHQPIANEDATVWAAQNGEIYNFAALREGLEAGGHRFATRCDTEVLVHLYEVYGRDLVHALEGMFAFAIWDQPRRRLLLGRDRCGEKPLFVRPAPEGIAFASELGALLALESGAGWQLNPAALDAYFVLGYVPPSMSLVSGVVQLPPGSILEWSPGEEPKVSTYWSAPAAPPEPDGRKLSELVADADALLAKGVRSRMISDVPLGLFLSGGLDSTLVAAIAREQGEVRTFSVGYDIGTVSETGAARAVAERLGTPHEELVLRLGDVEQLTLGLFGAIDQPLADQALVPMHALARHAAQSVKVIVGGEGADEYFGGYPRYRWLERARRVRAVGARPSLALAASAWPQRGRRERLELLAAALSDEQRNFSWVTGGRGQLASELYGERLRGRAVGADGAAGAELRFAGDGGVAQEAMACDRRSWLPGDVLTKADRAGMLGSLEIRTPFLHRELIEFACSVPFQTHAAGGEKALLRAVLERRLPGSAAPRKRGFRVPAAQWLSGPLRGLVEHCAHDSRLVGEGWFDATAVQGLAADHLAGRADHAAVLWPLVALNVWLEGQHGRRAS